MDIGGPLWLDVKWVESNVNYLDLKWYNFSWTPQILSFSQFYTSLPFQL